MINDDSGASRHPRDINIRTNEYVLDEQQSNERWRRRQRWVAQEKMGVSSSYLAGNLMHATLADISTSVADPNLNAST